MKFEFIAENVFNCNQSSTVSVLFNSLNGTLYFRLCLKMGLAAIM